MTLEKIKAAVRFGLTVYYQTTAYVVEEYAGQWYIYCAATNHRIGLTYRDGVTLNGKPSDFFVA